MKYTKMLTMIIIRWWDYKWFCLSLYYLHFLKCLQWTSITFIIWYKQEMWKNSFKEYENIIQSNEHTNPLTYLLNSFVMILVHFYRNKGFYPFNVFTDLRETWVIWSVCLYVILCNILKNLSTGKENWWCDIWNSSLAFTY